MIVCKVNIYFILCLAFAGWSCVIWDVLLDDFKVDSVSWGDTKYTTVPKNIRIVFLKESISKCYIFVKNSLNLA